MQEKRWHTLTTIDDYELRDDGDPDDGGRSASGKPKSLRRLPRLRIWNQGVKRTKDGKRSVEGCSRGSSPSGSAGAGDVRCAETVTIRPFLQRHMYEALATLLRTRSVKTVMHETPASVDLKDTERWVQLRQASRLHRRTSIALSDDMKETIESIRRMCVSSSDEIEMNNPIDERGEAVVIDTHALHLGNRRRDRLQSAVGESVRSRWGSSAVCRSSMRSLLVTG